MPYSQPITSHDNTDNVKDVSLEFQNIELPLTKLFNEIPMSNEEAANILYNWFDDNRLSFKGAIKTEYDSAGSPTAMVLDSTAGLRPHSIINGDGQIYRVESVTNATTLVVTYLGGETNANLAVDAVIEYQGQANPENMEFVESDFAPPIAQENYTQIFSDYTRISNTQKACSTYVSGDTLTKDAMKKLKRIKLQLAKAVYNNTYGLNPSDNANGRIMRGMRYFINANGYSVTGTFTEANINAWISEAKNENGAIPTELWMNPKTRANFNALDSDSLKVQNGDSVRGQFVQFFITEEGDTIMLKDDINLPVGEIYLVNVSEQLKLVPLNGRQMKMEKLAKTGDGEKWEIVGEYTLEFLNSSTTAKYVIS